MQARWVGAVHLIFIFIALKEKVDTYSLAPYSLAKYVKHLNTKPPVVVVVDVNKKATPDHDSGHYHSDGNYYNHGKKESDSKNEHYEKEYYHSDGKYYYHGKKKLNTQSEYGDPEYYHPKDNYHHHGKKKQNSKKYYYPVHYNYDGYYHDHVKMERNSLNDEEDYNPYDDKNSYNGFLKYYSKIEPEEENREYENNKEESNLISILNNRAEGNMKDDRETNRYREATSDETAKEHHLIHRLKDMVTQLKHNKELKSAKNSEDELSNAKTSRMDKVHLLNHILKVATGRESYGRLPASVLREAIISYENCVRKQKGSMRTVFCGINDELYKKDKKKRINDSEPQWGDCGGRDHCEEKQHEKKGKGTGRTMPPELKNTVIYSE